MVAIKLTLLVHAVPTSFLYLFCKSASRIECVYWILVSITLNSRQYLQELKNNTFDAWSVFTGERIQKGVSLKIKSELEAWWFQKLSSSGGENLESKEQVDMNNLLWAGKELKNLGSLTCLPLFYSAASRLKFTHWLQHVVQPAGHGLKDSKKSAVLGSTEPTVLISITVRKIKERKMSDKRKQNYYHTSWSNYIKLYY